MDSVLRSPEQRLHALLQMVGRWKHHTKSMLKVYSAVVTDATFYQLPFMSPLVSQYERLEILHKKGLRLPLRVPQLASNNSFLRGLDSLASSFDLC